jgi:hypothetical protein
MVAMGFSIDSAQRIARIAIRKLAQDKAKLDPEEAMNEAMLLILENRKKQLGGYMDPDLLCLYLIRASKEKRIGNRFPLRSANCAKNRLNVFLNSVHHTCLNDVSSIENKDEIETLLGSLEAFDRSLIQMHFIQGIELKKIAIKKRRHYDTIKIRLKKAINKLRAKHGISDVRLALKAQRDFVSDFIKQTNGTYRQYHRAATAEQIPIAPLDYFYKTLRKLRKNGSCPRRAKKPAGHRREVLENFFAIHGLDKSYASYCDATHEDDRMTASHYHRSRKRAEAKMRISA